MKELKKYARYLYDWDGRFKVIINDLSKGNCGIGKIGDVLDDIEVQKLNVKTADTILELAEVGDMVEVDIPFTFQAYTETNGKINTQLHQISTLANFKRGKINAGGGEWLTKEVKALWIKQDNETYKRYEVQS